MHQFYFPEGHPDIQAGLADGNVIPWRIDASGRQWFRSVPPIHGVEPGYITGDDEDEDIILADLAEDDDDECEFTFDFSDEE